MSQIVLISTFCRCANPRFSELPWPRTPMLASTTRSFAPRTRLLKAGAWLAEAVDGLSRSRPTKAAAAMPPTRVANARREMSFLSWS